jgi:hypothetical protein
MQLANGTPLKVVSENVGHSTSSFTADVYVTVTTELAEDAARRMYIPRGSRGEAAR